MIFGRKKASAIDRRLQELQREMSRVGTEIKVLSHYKKAGDAHQFAGSESETAMRAVSPAGFSSAGGKSRISGVDDPLSREQSNGKINSAFAGDTAARDGGDLPLFEQRGPLSMTGREKFANYFMAGHFSNLRPLRQEKRIIRNKAIVMIVLVVLALIWLFFSLHNR